MSEITPKELHTALARKDEDSSVDFINVCTPAEYKEKHIPGVRNVPLDEIDQHLNEFSNVQRIYVHCQSGRRAGQAITRLRELGVQAELVNVQGGLTAWHTAGLPTESKTNRLPIMRQVLLIAGVLVLLGLGLGWFVSSLWFVLAAFVGLGLAFAGLTGWCGMSYALARMPWNR